MKEKSTSQSAFFNRRVLVGLFVVLGGVLIALMGLGTFSGLTATSAQAQQRPAISQSLIHLLPPGFDCASIDALGINKQENHRAGLIMIACGRAQGGGADSAFPAFSKVVQNLLPSPLAYGTTDENLITGADIFSHVTQSETFAAANPDNPNQIVVAFNDSRNWPAFTNISGASVSTDGGTTFTRLTTGAGTSPFNNTFGDPVVMYNRESGVWFTVWLDAACGGQGLGGYKSTTPWDPNSWTHFCIHSGSSDDRESAWVDNNPASPHYGNMYVSWNDFALGGNLKVRYSTDNGLTWTNERQLAPASPFIRNVQLTGDLGGTGHVYLAGMDEGGGGFPHNDKNLIYRSTDGGNTWANTYTGPIFPGPGVTAVGYFACMFSDAGGYWRHEGWGQPAANNGVVHLVYAQDGAGADAGDVYYIRSTNNGVTFGAPFKLNSDTTTRPQWQPNISAATDGSLLAVWYDARESTTCAKGNPAVPCYRMWARKSTDNGATWLADMEFSDVVTPLPGQPDAGIQTTYAGDYDYSYQVGNQHLHPWTDGRVTISGQSQQDAFFDREPAGGGTPTPTPTVTPTVTPTATPGGIPCGDLVSFQVRCKPSATGTRLQAKLTLTNTSHSGEQVTITVDGNPNVVTISGNLAKLQINNPAPGAHTVELTNPAGCFAPVNTNCP